MKKKIGLFLALVLTLSMVLAGCTSEQVGLLNEMKKIEAWEASSIKQSMTMTIDVENEKATITADVTGFTNLKDATSSLDMTMKCKELNMNIPVKMYINKDKVYINKEYFAALAQLSGADVAKINKLSADYIILDLNAGNDVLGLTNQLGTMTNLTSTDATYKLLQNISTDIGLNVPVTKEGNTYKIKLTSDQLVDIAKNVINTSVANLDKLNTTYKLGLSKEEINEFVKGYNSQKAEIEEALPEVKQILKGSYFDMTYKFEESKVTQDAKLVIKAEGIFNLSMDMSVQSVKEEPKNITMPANAVVMSINDITELFNSSYTFNTSYVPNTPNTLNIDVKAGTYVSSGGNTKSIKIIKENGKTYLPLKQVLAEFGYQANYDQKAKKVYAVINNNKINFTTITKNGVSYIAVNELLSEDYIDGYNLDDEIVLWLSID